MSKAKLWRTFRSSQCRAQLKPTNRKILSWHSKNESTFCTKSSQQIPLQYAFSWSRENFVKWNSWANMPAMCRRVYLELDLEIQTVSLSTRMATPGSYPYLFLLYFYSPYQFSNSYCLTDLKRIYTVFCLGIRAILQLIKCHQIRTRRRRSYFCRN